MLGCIEHGRQLSNPLPSVQRDCHHFQNRPLFCPNLYIRTLVLNERLTKIVSACEQIGPGYRLSGPVGHLPHPCLDVSVHGSLSVVYRSSYSSFPNQPASLVSHRWLMYLVHQSVSGLVCSNLWSVFPFVHGFDKCLVHEFPGNQHVFYLSDTGLIYYLEY
jgi:hypothetical protein